MDIQEWLFCWIGIHPFPFIACFSPLSVCLRSFPLNSSSFVVQPISHFGFRFIGRIERKFYRKKICYSLSIVFRIDNSLNGTDSRPINAKQTNWKCKIERKKNTIKLKWNQIQWKSFGCRDWWLIIRVCVCGCVSVLESVFVARWSVANFQRTMDFGLLLRSIRNSKMLRGWQAYFAWLFRNGKKLPNTTIN